MVIHELEINKHSILKISKDIINGENVGHIRLWSRDDRTNRFRPTNKCFSFNLNNLNEIIKGLIFLKVFQQTEIYRA